MSQLYLSIYCFLATVFSLMAAVALAVFIQKKISKQRFYGIFSLGVSGALLFVFAVLDPVFPYTPLSMAAWISAYWALAICAIAASAQELSGGKNVADSRAGFLPFIQILLSLCVLSAGPWILFESVTREKPTTVPAVIEKAEDNRPEGTLIFDKFNLSYKPPTGSWVKIDTGKLNPGILVSMFQAKPTASFQIGAQAGMLVEKGQEQAFMQMAYAQMMKPFKNTIIKQEPERFLGIDGYRIDSRHSLPNVGEQIHRIHWTGIRNGYFYDLAAFAPISMPFEDLRKIFDAHVNGISLLEKEKTSTPQSPAEDYKSNRYPYIVHAKNSGWIDWSFTIQADRTKLADYRLTTEAAAALLVYPILFEDEAPPLEILIEALVNMNQLSYNKIPPMNIRPVKENGYEGVDIDCENKINEDQYDYRIKILRSKNLAYFVTAYKSRTLPGGSVAELEKGRSIFEPLKPATLPDMKSLDENEKSRHNEAYLWIAKIFYQKGDNNKALYFLKKAFDWDPQDEGTLNDIMTTYQELKMEKEGIQYAEKYKEFINDKPRLKKKLADLFSNNVDWKKAQQMYEKLIKEGDIKQGLLYDYLDLMKKNKAEKEAFKKLKELASSGELETRVAIAGLLADENQDEDALNIIRGLYEKQPRDTKLSRGFFYQLLKMERYTDVVEKAVKHLKEYGDDADVYFFQGFAFAALKRFDEAIAAFKKAHEIEPDSEYFKSFVDCLTQLQNQASGKMLPYNLDINRTIKLNKSVLKIEETLKFIGQDAAAWKDELDETTEVQKKDKIKAMLKSFYGKSELESIEIVPSENDTFEMKITYTLFSLFQNAGSKRVIWLPRAWEAQYLVPVASENSEMPLSIYSPLKIHAKAVLHYSPEAGMEISDMPVANTTTGCIEIQSKFSQEAGVFKYDIVYTRSGGTFMKTQLEQCQSDVAEEFKKSMPSFLVKIVRGQVSS